VIARGLRWEVVETEPAGDEVRFHLRCLEGGLRGEELNLLSPFERVEPVAREFAPERAGRLQPFRVYHEAFLLEQALGPGALLAAQPGRLDLAPYQLVPVMRALQMSRARLMLADDVGLGKTVQAGLVMAELIARRRAHRILIVAPAGLLMEQWRDEMRERFGLRFDVLDRDRLQEIRYGAELGANPFDHVALGLISIDFLKQERVLQEIERTQYDMVVIDEAHHCMRQSAAAERDDSLRRRLAEVLARQADHLLLLTATPHDGYDPHFASLLELLDASLVDGRGVLRGEAYLRHVVRRLKRHIKDPATGEPLFHERRVYPCRVELAAESHAAYAAMQKVLVALVAPQVRRALRTRRYGDVLAFVSLLKRSVSTVRACRNTIEVIADRLTELSEKGTEEQETRRQRLRTMRDYRRRLERFGVLAAEEEQDYALLEAEDMAAELAQAGGDTDDFLDQLAAVKREVRRGTDKLKRTVAVRDGLRELLRLADEAASEDPKLPEVLRQIAAIRAEEPRANILVYTEYTDSLNSLSEALTAARAAGQLDGEVLVLCGDDDERTRRRVTDRFRQEPKLVLVSTDATAEGINLHQRCHHLIHLELPYNPNRLEQRNGRIDRYGQKHAPCVRYLYLPGTFEERLLLRLVAKYEKQRARLNFVPNTLGQVTELSDSATVGLLEGVAAEPQHLFERQQRSFDFAAAHDEETASTPYREMLLEIERAISGFERSAKSSSWLVDKGLNAEQALVTEADQARERGDRLGTVDLLRFVTSAIRADSPDPRAVRQREDGIWELKLSSAWTHGLEDLPGFDAERRVLLLTTEVAVVEDAEHNPVGYIGRAHPIVRRALDRVRNVQFGGKETSLDRRVSAARGDGDEPALLVTYVGRVQSAAGRELERVVAITLSRQHEPQVLAEPAAWMPLLDADRAVSAAGAWEQHFAAWGVTAIEAAKPWAERAFAELAEAFVVDHRALLAREAAELRSWLAQRVQELCGAAPEPSTASLFERDAPSAPLPPWATLREPTERLAAFATCRDNPIRARREAEVVLSLHQRREHEHQRRLALEPPSVTLLGLLMLLPRGGAPS